MPSRRIDGKTGPQESSAVSYLTLWGNMHPPSVEPSVAPSISGYVLKYILKQASLETFLLLKLNMNF